jgi:hypothetical protein
MNTSHLTKFRNLIMTAALVGLAMPALAQSGTQSSGDATQRMTIRRGTTYDQPAEARRNDASFADQTTRERYQEQVPQSAQGAQPRAQSDQLPARNDGSDLRAWEQYARDQELGNETLPARNAYATSPQDWTWVAIDYDNDRLVDAIVKMYTPSLQAARSARVDAYELQVRDRYERQYNEPLVGIAFDRDKDRQFDAFEFMDLTDLRAAQMESQRRLVQGAARAARSTQPSPQSQALPEEVPARDTRARSPQAADDQIGASMRPELDVPSPSSPVVQGRIRDFTFYMTPGFSGDPHMLATIEEPNGRLTRVDFGPRSMLGRLDLNEGDWVRVLGTMINTGNQPMLIATRAETEDRTFVITSSGVVVETNR